MRQKIAKYGLSIDGGHIEAQTDNRIIDSLSEAHAEAVAENIEVQRGIGRI